MKIAILNGSPRKENTAAMVEAYVTPLVMSLFL